MMESDPDYRMGSDEPFYVFAPRSHGSHDQDLSDKLAGHRLEQEEGDGGDAVHTLSRGAESFALHKARLEAFRRVWAPEEAALKAVLYDISRQNVKQIGLFIKNKTSFSTNAGIPVGLLMTTPGCTIPADLLKAAMQEVETQEHISHVDVPAAQSTSLRSLLRFINQKAITRCSQSSVARPNHDRAGPHLDYDLERLHELVQRSALKRVVILFRDGEAIESNVLSDMIVLFSAWRDRIPMCLFFGIRTSIELFEAKLSDRAGQSFDGQSFFVENVQIEELFMVNQNMDPREQKHDARDDRNSNSSPSHHLWLGPRLIQRILSRQSQNALSPLTYIHTLKYIRMSHFFANSLSVAFGDQGILAPFSERHFDIIRRLPSFRNFCEDHLARGNHSFVRRLLADNDLLEKTFAQEKASCLAALRSLDAIVNLLHEMQLILLVEHWKPSDIYVAAMDGQLADSGFVQSIMTALRRASSNTLGLCLEKLMPHRDLYHKLEPLQAAHQSLLQSEVARQDANLRSGHDTQFQCLRTTVVAHKVELSQQSATLTEAETAYTKLVDQVHDTVMANLTARLNTPRHFFPIELFMYDLLSPYRDVIIPQPRLAIERGFSRCYDYLGRGCCIADDSSWSFKQPATSVLYRLCQECGAVFSLTDLWSAFWALMKPQDDLEREGAKRLAVALFEIGLAELKYMGIVKHNRKGIESLTKLSWEGL